MKMAGTKKKLWLIDSTLRDGEQSPGIVFSLENKLTIAGMLDDAGINELETGIPAMGKNECNEISIINKSGLSCRITAWCRALKKDIALAYSCGISSVHISFPVSEILLKVMNKNQKTILSDLKEILLYSCRLFEFVSVGAMDATRADLNFLIQFVQTAKQNGAYRIRIADTVGTGTPSSSGSMIKRLRSSENEIHYEFHGHNDLGMATANSISAAEAGASAISATVNGIGERAGNARLEEVVAAIKYASDKSTLADPVKITPVCKYLAKITRRPIPLDKPITGSHIFSHESGIHCSAQLKDPFSFQHFRPEDMGHDTGHGPGAFIIGKHSGREVISHKLQLSGLSPENKSLNKILVKVRKFAGEKGRALTDSELLMIYDSVCPKFSPEMV